MEHASIAGQVAAQIARLGTADTPWQAGIEAFQVRQALRAFGAPAAPVLRQYWPEADEHLRDIILDVLGDIGDAQDIPWLFAPAAQPGHVWHQSALGSLAKLAGELALPLLTALLAEAHLATRQRHYAVSYLRSITTPATAREAARACARGLCHDADERVRCEAAWAYYLLPEAAGEVSTAAEHELLHPGADTLVLQIACKAILVQRGEAALLRLWPQLSSVVRATVLGVAARRSGWAFDAYGPLAESVIQHGLADADELVRVRAIAVAMVCRDPAVTEQLCAMLAQERAHETWYGLCDALLLLQARSRVVAMYRTWPKGPRDQLRAYLRQRRLHPVSESALQAEVVALAAELPTGRQRRPAPASSAAAEAEAIVTAPLPSPAVQLTAHVSLVVPLPAALPLKRRRHPAVTLAAGALAVDWRIETVVEAVEFDEPLHSIHMQMRFSDSTGQAWRATATVRPADLCAQLLGATQKPLAVRRAEHLPVSWRRALTERVLLGGLHDLWDSRAYIVVRLDDDEREVLMKYQGPRVSMGSLAGQGTPQAVILVERLYHDGEPLPALAFCVPWVELVFGYRWHANRQRWRPVEDWRVTLEPGELQAVGMAPGP